MVISTARTPWRTFCDGLGAIGVGASVLRLSGVVRGRSGISGGSRGTFLRGSSGGHHCAYDDDEVRDRREERIGFRLGPFAPGRGGSVLRILGARGISTGPAGCVEVAIAAGKVPGFVRPSLLAYCPSRKVFSFTT